MVKINVGEQNQACPDNHSRCIGLLAMPTSRRMSAGALLHRTGHRRTGRGGGQLPPPIRAVCGPEFGQIVDIMRAKHMTCLKNTNLGSVTVVNGISILSTPKNMDPGKFLLLPPPPLNTDPGKFLLLPPPPTESIRAKICLPPPPKWMLARTPMELVVSQSVCIAGQQWSVCVD